MSARELVFRVLVSCALFTCWWLLSGCVRSVTVCVDARHQLQRSTWERPARDDAGASVCAEVGPRD